jgi:hypothetical protein
MSRESLQCCNPQWLGNEKQPVIAVGEVIIGTHRPSNNGMNVKNLYAEKFFMSVELERQCHQGKGSTDTSASLSSTVMEIIQRIATLDPWLIRT